MNAISDDQKKAIAKIIRYCPACGSHLREREICDVMAIGLICDKGHRFYVPQQVVRLNEQGGPSFEMRIDGSDLMAIAREWLSNKKLRSHLNNSLAEVLRVILDMNNDAFDKEKQLEAARIGVKNYCPQCGEKLSVVEGDGYSASLKCMNNHEESGRGNILTFSISLDALTKNRLRLCLDTYDPKASLDIFLQDEGAPLGVPPQIFQLLKDFLK